MVDWLQVMALFDDGGEGSFTVLGKIDRGWCKEAVKADDEKRSSRVVGDFIQRLGQTRLLTDKVYGCLRTQSR